MQGNWKFNLLLNCVSRWTIRRRQFDVLVGPWTLHWSDARWPTPRCRWRRKRPQSWATHPSTEASTMSMPCSYFHLPLLTRLLQTQCKAMWNPRSEIGWLQSLYHPPLRQSSILHRTTKQIKMRNNNHLCWKIYNTTLVVAGLPFIDSLLIWMTIQFFLLLFF